MLRIREFWYKLKIIVSREKDYVTMEVGGDSWGIPSKKSYTSYLFSFIYESRFWCKTAL